MRLNHLRNLRIGQHLLLSHMCLLLLPRHLVATATYHWLYLHLLIGSLHPALEIIELAVHGAALSSALGALAWRLRDSSELLVFKELVVGGTLDAGAVGGGADVAATGFLGNLFTILLVLVRLRILLLVSKFIRSRYI